MSFRTWRRQNVFRHGITLYLHACVKLVKQCKYSNQQIWISGQTTSWRMIPSYSWVSIKYWIDVIFGDVNSRATGEHAPETVMRKCRGELTVPSWRNKCFGILKSACDYSRSDTIRVTIKWKKAWYVLININRVTAGSMQWSKAQSSKNLMYWKY
jgi:hypothetical protein